MNVRPGVVKPHGGERGVGVVGASFPSIANPTKNRRKLKHPDFSAETIRGLAKTNLQMATSIKGLNERRQTLLSKIDSLEGELIRNQDLASSLREQLAKMSLPAEYTNYNSMLNSVRREIVEDECDSDRELLVLDEKAIDRFMRDNPLIMKGFASVTTGFPEYIASFQDIPAECNNAVVSRAVLQLHRLSQCFKIFENLSGLTDSQRFDEILRVGAITLLGANGIHVLVLDHKSGEYVCTIGECSYSVPLEGTLLGNVVESQTVGIYTNAADCDDFRPDIDGLFVVPGALMCLPIGKQALLVTSMETVGLDDIEVGKFLGVIMEPVLDMYNRVVFLNKQVSLRRILHLFEADLAANCTFDALLPYLLGSLVEFVGAAGVELFMVTPESFWSFDIDEMQTLVRKEFPKCGTVNWVANQRESYQTPCLSPDSSDVYDAKIDKWAVNKSYAAFPVILTDRDMVIAVLCLSNRVTWNKFTVWDVEIAKIMCSTLSLILPRCISHADGVIEDDRSVALRAFPTFAKETNFPAMEETKATENIAKRMQAIVDAEWMTIYVQKNGIGDLERLLTLHNGVSSDSAFLDRVFCKAVYTGSRDCCVKDCSEIKDFKTVGDQMASHALVMAITKVQKDGMMVIAMNSNSPSERFDPVYIDMMKAGATFLFYSQRVRELNQIIVDVKAANQTMSNAMQIAESLVYDSDALPKLLDVTRDLLGLEAYVLMRRKQMTKSYDVIISSQEGLHRSVVLSDVLMSKVTTMKEVMICNDFHEGDYAKSAIISCLPELQMLVIRSIAPDNSTIAVFSGSSVASNHHVLFNYFVPLIRVYANRFDLQSAVGRIESVELGNVNPYRSSIDCEELESVDFSITKYTESQKLEILLIISETMGLNETVGVKMNDFARYFLNLRESYSKTLPFHNWDHAVDCVQLLFVIFRRGAEFLTRTLHPMITAGLFFAIMSHDVDHDGCNSKFHKTTSSPLCFSHGFEGTQERHHISVGLDLILRSMPDIKTSPLFWTVFSETILTSSESTEVVQAWYAGITREGDWENEQSQIRFAQFLFSISNASGCFRSFEEATNTTKAIVTELESQSECAKQLGFDLGPISTPRDLAVLFYEDCLVPMTRKLAAIIPELEPLRKIILENLDSWESVEQ